MDRERVLNAMNEAMVDAIEEAFHAIEQDDSVRLHLTGTGRGFASAAI